MKYSKPNLENKMDWFNQKSLEGEKISFQKFLWNGNKIPMKKIYFIGLWIENSFLL